MALRYLAKKGYTPVARNYRTRHGDFDLMMCDERPLALVEVKLQQGTDFGDPLEAVTARKRARIRLVAERYLASRGEGFTAGSDELRFDVLNILLGTGKAEVRHVKVAI